MSSADIMVRRDSPYNKSLKLTFAAAARRQTQLSSIRWAAKPIWHTYLWVRRSAVFGLIILCAQFSFAADTYRSTHFRDEQIAELRKLTLVAKHSLEKNDPEFLRRFVREGLFPESNLDIGGSPLLYAGFVSKAGTGWKFEFDGFGIRERVVERSDRTAKAVLSQESRFREEIVVIKHGDKGIPQQQVRSLQDESNYGDLTIIEMSAPVSGKGFVFVAYSKNVLTKYYGN